MNEAFRLNFRLFLTLFIDSSLTEFPPKSRNLRFAFYKHLGLILNTPYVIPSLHSPQVYLTLFNMAQFSNKTANCSPGDDYNLFKPIDSTSGLRQGLTSYGDAHFSLFLRKVFIKALGYSEDALSRPIIGIINTHSALNPCHANIPQLIEAVKRGVQLNGGLAVEFPTISVHESFSSPTSMYLRNLMSMDTEEMIKAQPLDACIMIGGMFSRSYSGCYHFFIPF